MSETWADQLARVQGMASGNCGTWDLSPNDEAALRAVLAELERLQSALRLACTPPWPTWTDATAENVETLVNFWMRAAATGEAQQ